VREFHEADAVGRLKAAAVAGGFAVKEMTIELRGRCAACRGVAGSSDAVHRHDHDHD
jgi:Fe2+ or Zn2+ uptake regulation protein